MEASYTNDWNLPESVIEKFGLVNEGKTIGNSFINEARIFAIPEIGGVDVLECNLSGEVSADRNTFFVFFHRGKNKGYIEYSIEVAKDLSKADFLAIINNEIKRNNW
jgi:hypothetical protein